MTADCALDKAEKEAADTLSDLARQSQDWDATETAARIKNGDVSTVEIIEAAIERARREQPNLHAICYESYDDAILQAKAERNGCFAGVPTFIKDMEDIEGAPTTFGSAAVPATIRHRTADSVAEFMSTGAISLGKSTTAEFGLTGTYEPTDGEPTRNPFNLEHTAGGSSSGAAALVASKVVPVAHGGDGGGSIRVPAAFCGLVGLKATRGRLATMDSTKRMLVKLNTYGIVTRTVRDTASFFAHTDTAPIKGMSPIGHVEGPGRPGLRIGLYIDPPLKTPVDAEVRSAVENLALKLTNIGHRVDLVPAPYDQQLVDDFLNHWALLAAGIEEIVKRTPGGDVTKLQGWTRHLAKWARKNWYRMPGAVLRLRRFPKAYAKNFERCDVILSPVCATPAPRLGYLHSDQPYDELLAKILDIFPYTSVQNAAGTPALAIPIGESKDGLPIGAHLAAPWGEEKRLLELAYAIEGL